jgi:hypothetical protein
MKTTRIPLRLLLTGMVAALALGSSQAQNRTAGDVAVIDELMWSLEMSGVSAWAEANEFCDTLETGGFDDWRLPTLSELEALHDPGAPSSLRGPFELDDCCAWSSTSLEELPADRKGNLPAPGGPPGNYYWGFLFAGGIGYYSNSRQLDGFAMCARVYQ